MSKCELLFKALKNSLRQKVLIAYCKGKDPKCEIYKLFEKQLFYIFCKLIPTYPPKKSAGALPLTCARCLPPSFGCACDEASLKAESLRSRRIIYNVLNSSPTKAPFTQLLPHLVHISCFNYKTCTLIPSPP